MNGSLRARSWEEASPCPCADQRLAWRAHDGEWETPRSGQYKGRRGPYGLRGNVHPKVRFGNSRKTFVPVCPRLALHVAHPHPPPAPHTTHGHGFVHAVSRTWMLLPAVFCSSGPRCWPVRIKRQCECARLLRSESHPPLYFHCAWFSPSS